MLTPSERAMRARIAAHAQHAQGKTNTKAATVASQVTRFEDAVDPDRKLAPDERAKRAEHARKAYMQKLAFASAKARRANAAARRESSC